MSVLRQANLLGQQRLDVPHLRAIESSIAADFDLLAGRIMAGEKPLTVKGLELATTGAIGSPATSLQLAVAGAMVLHYQASEHGSIFSVPADAAVELLNSTNAKVIGSFTAGQVNYVGLDLRRSADDSTADLVMFMDADTKLETPKSVPLARTLQYRIVISTTDFSSTPALLPIAKVTTNGTNIVTAIEDARNLTYRLGSGGSVPNRYKGFGWAAGRAENTSGNVFAGGDKNITSLKDWMDAAMTRLWEVGGGQYWYSPTSDRELKLVMGQPVIPATSDNFKWTLGSQTLDWASLSVAFGNSPVAYNTINDGSAVLLDNQCLYVDINRTAITALNAQVASLTTLGQSAIPGQRFVIAWRRGNYIFTKDHPFEVGRTLLNVANELVFGVVKLKYASGTPSAPLVLANDANGAYSNTADGGNSAAFIGTGNGTGAGLQGTGGASAGSGVKGTGGTGGKGGEFLGNGAGSGLTATGGATGTGIIVQGGASGGNAIQATSNAANQHAVIAIALAGNAIGVRGESAGTGAGVEGRAGSSSGLGLRGVGKDNAGGAGGTGASISGGNATGASGNGGVGLSITGGASAAGLGDVGGSAISATGGGGTDGGTGGAFTGGSAALQGGYGIIATGGGSTDTGGDGIIATGAVGGSSNGVGVNARAAVDATGAAPTVAAKLSNGNLKLAGANVNSNVAPGTNTLTPGLVPKAWALVSYTSVGPAVTVIAGQNISSVAFNGSDIDITLVNGLTSNNTCAVITGQVPNYFWSVPNMQASPIKVQAYDHTNAHQNLSTQSGKFSIVIYGLQ